MLIAVVIIAVTYFMYDTGISYIISSKCILWGFQVLTNRKGKNVGIYGEFCDVRKVYRRGLATSHWTKHL